MRKVPLSPIYIFQSNLTQQEKYTQSSYQNLRYCCHQVYGTNLLQSQATRLLKKFKFFFRREKKLDH